MVRILGNLFIAFGVLMCLTVILSAPGLACVAVGALLRISARPRKDQ
jgi:hypothetical protein